jgi:hypothetical protein
MIDRVQLWFATEESLDALEESGSDHTGAVGRRTLARERGILNCESVR